MDDNDIRAMARLSFDERNLLLQLWHSGNAASRLEQFVEAFAVGRMEKVREKMLAEAPLATTGTTPILGTRAAKKG